MNGRGTCIWRGTVHSGKDEVISLFVVISRTASNGELYG